MLVAPAVRGEAPEGLVFASSELGDSYDAGDDIGGGGIRGLNTNTEEHTSEPTRSPREEKQEGRSVEQSTAQYFGEAVDEEQDHEERQRRHPVHKICHDSA